MIQIKSYAQNKIVKELSKRHWMESWFAIHASQHFAQNVYLQNMKESAIRIRYNFLKIICIIDNVKNANLL